MLEFRKCFSNFMISICHWTGGSNIDKPQDSINDDGV